MHAFCLRWPPLRPGCLAESWAPHGLLSMADLVAALRDLGHLAAELGPSEARRLLPQVAALSMLLASKAAEVGPEAPAPTKVEGEAAVWLNPTQVEQTFGLPVPWLLEHARELEQVGLVAKPSRKLRLYHRAKLARWVEARRTDLNAPH